jgi:hypothetical protein
MAIILTTFKIVPLLSQTHFAALFIAFQTLPQNPLASTSKSSSGLSRSNNFTASSADSSENSEC